MSDAERVAGDEPRARPPVIRAAELFGAGREVVIKLILTK